VDVRVPVSAPILHHDSYETKTPLYRPGRKKAP
jgi:hypothetical protein